MGCEPKAGSMPGQRQRGWPDIERALDLGRVLVRVLHGLFGFRARHLSFQVPQTNSSIGDTYTEKIRPGCIRMIRSVKYLVVF